MKEKTNGVLVYRGMSPSNSTDRNVWVTNDKEHASFFANQSYNQNGVVNAFILPNEVIKDLCNPEIFEEIMSENDAWQEIPEDSSIWDDYIDDDYEPEYDLQHDLCFPSKKQLKLIKNEGYSGYLFEFETGVYYIFLFNGKVLKPVIK